MDIRPATPTDVAALQAIYAHHVLHGLASFELVPPAVDEMHSRFDGISSAGFPYLVAVEAGTVLGYAHASAYRTRPGYRFTVEDSVYIDPRHVGRGFGRRLLTRLIGECERRGHRQMLAVIGDWANTPSIELHRACGFNVTGKLQSVGFKFGRWVDSVLMQRALGDADRTAPA
jgi:phosphinothricin acetyltransferase